MHKVIGGVIFMIGFLFLLYAGSAVDIPYGSMHDVAFGCIWGIVLCASSLVLINWENI